MNPTLSLSSPFQSIFWSKESSFLHRASLILAGVFLLAFASQLSIPLQPVPLTFQSVTVILIGMTYGARCGAAVVAAYLIAGACGLPVFADHSGGIQHFFGPTAGYLIGFLPAAYISGYLAQKGWAKSIIRSFMVALLGASVIFLCGLSVLSLSIGWDKAIAVGLMPFIISEPIKLAAASFIIPHCWKKP